MGVRRSPKEASRDAAKSKDFEVASETTQDATAEAKKIDIGIEANSIKEDSGMKLELERSNGVSAS